MIKAIKLTGFCILLFLIGIFSSCRKNVDINNLEKKNIALVLKTNYGYYWGSLKMGAEAAAREFNVNIEYSAPDDEEDINGQIKLVNQALEKKTSGLILAASDYKSLAGVTEKAYNQGIPVIIIDSEVATEKINSYIATDNLEAGKKAGNVLIDICGTDCNVAVMNFVKGSRNAEEREIGLLNVISKYPNIKITAKEYCQSDTKRAYALTKKIISENKQINAIVALNETASEGVAQAIDELNLKGKVKIIAFESTLQEIEFLDKGVIQATVIQNPFSMGYLSVKNIVDLMNGKNIEKRIFIDSKVINKDNMYLPENQKLLFPLIQ